jgi:hypothetical protein
MTDAERKRLWKILWKNTHKDFKGKIAGVQTVMGWLKYSPNCGSCTVSMTTISEEELIERTKNKA